MSQAQQKSSRSSDLQPAENAVLARLRSFSATTWFGKPPALSAQAAAAKGWTNTGPDQLSCLCCGSQILCKLPLNPWSEAAAGIVTKYSQRLVDAHSPQCRQRSLLGLGDQQPPPPAAAAAAAAQQPPPSRSSTSVGFPIIPAKKLSAAYYARLQELQQMQSLPAVSASTRARLAAAAARLDPSILTGLAALLHTPLDALQHEAAAAAVVTPGSTSSSTTAAAPSTNLSREQAQVLTALCGWQPRQLLPPHLTPAAAADAGGALFGVSHLLPSRRSSQTGQHSTPPAGQPQPAAAAAAAGSSVNPACTALECELCGTRVGLWRFSCSGPFFAQQLSSKAMRALTTAAAEPSSTQPPSEAAAAGERSINGTPTRAAATDQNPTSPSPAAAAAGDAGSREPQLTRAPSGSAAAAAGSLSPTTPQAPQQQQQHQAGEVVAAASASPEAVFSTLTHTIAGGSLLTAGASGGRPFGAAAMQPTFGSPAGFGSAGKPPMQQQQQTPPAAAGGATAGGGSSSGGSKLFEGLAGVPAGASVFGSPPPPAAAGGPAGGPFGGSGGGGRSGQAAPAPVFGLQAFEVEEQRTKRRRSSSAAGPDFAAAAAAAVAAHTAGGPSATHDPAAAAAAAATGGQRPVTPETQATSPAAAAAGVAGGSGGGSGAGRGVRRFSKQRSGLVAAVAGATGEASADDTGALFDPIGAHRSWCPWVKDSSSAPAAAAAAGGSIGSIGSSGLVAAVRLGWAATLMAVREDEEQQELAALVQQQQQQQSEGGGGGGSGLLPQRDDYSSTAAVLARARQAMELMEGLP